MAKFKVIVSDPETGKSKVVELEGSRAVPFIGKRVGETIDGSVVGMSGKKLQIRGGSDKDGFPMRHDVHGGVRVSVIISKSVGFHPTREGERQRKTLRGNVITEEIVQVNAKVIEKAQKPEKTEKARKPRKVKAEVAEAEKPEPQTEEKTAIETPQPEKSGGESSEEAAQTA